MNDRNWGCLGRTKFTGRRSEGSRRSGRQAYISPVREEIRQDIATPTGGGWTENNTHRSSNPMSRSSKKIRESVETRCERGRVIPGRSFLEAGRRSWFAVKAGVAGPRDPIRGRAVIGWPRPIWPYPSFESGHGFFFLYWMRLVRDSWDPWVSLSNNGSYGTFQSGSLKVTALEVTVCLVEDIYRVTGG